MVSTPITGRRTRGVHVLGCNGSALADAMLAGAEPLGFAAGDTNLYRYVGNEAIGEVDPTGLDDVTVLPGQPYPGQPTLGGPGGVLKDPALRKKMKELQQQYKGGGPELGIIIVWNSKTGSVGWTTKGVKPREHNSVGFEDPQIPGWQPIGTIHTHQGSPKPSFPDIDNAKARGLPGAILWGPYYRIYGPPEQDARGRSIPKGPPINYQHSNPGAGHAS